MSGERLYSELRYFTSEEKLQLVSGRTLGPFTIAYETWGRLNEKKDNAVLIHHALSGSSHAAGFYSPEDINPGWWDSYIGPGKAFDTDKYFIICSNVIGGCDGSTGPSSLCPETGREYGSDFPLVTVQDMVRAQRKLIDHLGITRLAACAGGSFGGMQALSWSIMYPDMVHSVISIASAALTYAQRIAFNEAASQAIINDPNWNGGHYYHGTVPEEGLSLARIISHITYLSEKNMHERFGRKFQGKHPDAFSFKTEFMVESYLHHQGMKFADRFDANSFLYITRAIDLFDLSADFGGSLALAFAGAGANYLLVSFSTDWLYPAAMSGDVVQALRKNRKNVSYIDMTSDRGHDSFLLKNPQLEKIISGFLSTQYREIAEK